MWFRLARVLGMSVRRARQEIDAREFAEWLAYWEIEPFGEEWRIAAHSMSLMARVMTGKHLDPLKLIPGRKASRDIMTDDAIEAALLGHFADEEASRKPKRKPRESA